jgi:hypothetical protein
MSRDGVQSLRQLVIECKDVFRLKLGADPPANVKFLVIKLRDDADPVRMSARKYAPPQLMFMRHKIHELEELGLVYKNTGAELNPTEWPMPNLKDELHDLHGSEVFATLDFCQGYWQILCTKIH